MAQLERERLVLCQPCRYIVTAKHAGAGSSCISDVRVLNRIFLGVIIPASTCNCETFVNFLAQKRLLVCLVSLKGNEDT